MLIHFAFFAYTCILRPFKYILINILKLAADFLFCIILLILTIYDKSLLNDLSGKKSISKSEVEKMQQYGLAASILFIFCLIFYFSILSIKIYFYIKNNKYELKNIGTNFCIYFKGIFSEQ
jgi:hypothetical protein